MDLIQCRVASEIIANDSDQEIYEEGDVQYSTYFSNYYSMTNTLDRHMSA